MWWIGLKSDALIILWKWVSVKVVPGGKWPLASYMNVITGTCATVDNGTKTEGLLNRDVANRFKSKWPLYERKQETCSYYASYFIINVDIYIFSPKWITNTSCEFFSSSRSKTIKQVVDLKKEIRVNIPSDLVGLEKKYRGRCWECKALWLAF